MIILLAFILASAALAQSIPFPGPGRASVASSPWTFSTTVTVDHTKVPSTQTNFPVMFRSPVGTVTTVGTAVTFSSGDQFPTWMTTGRSIMINGVVYAISSRTTALLLVLTTSAGTQVSPVAYCGTPEFATVANGGKATNANGYDVVPFTESVGVTKYDFEREKYVAATGEVIDHFKQASLSSSVDTPVYYLMGNAAVTTDQSNKTAVWDSNFKFVWHMADNAASTTVLDSTSNAANGTNAANTSTKTIAGEIAGALNYVNASSDSTHITNPVVVGTDSITVSFWYQPLQTAASLGIMSFYDLTPISSSAPLVLRNNSGQLQQYNASIGFGGNLQTMTSGTYYHVVIVAVATTSQKAYVNGALVETIGGPGANLIHQSDFGIGSSYPDFGTGAVDEVRVSNIARTADWITTEYNNQGVPFTFFSMATNSAH